MVWVMAGSPDWQALAKAFEARAGRGGAGAARVLHELLPALHDDIRSVRKAPWLVGCWGQSRNHDDNAGKQIVTPAVLRTIGWLADVAMPARVCHSGLLHTYGYLFSRIETPYGKKRDRWIDGAIERGLGLRGLLRPMPKVGTLLHNVTWLLARIAFRDDDVWLRRLARARDGAAAGVRELDYAALRATRITESVRLADRRLVELHTELVPFGGKRLADARGGLLIYWCRTRAGKRLLTAFPMAGAMQRELVSAAHNLAAKGRSTLPADLSLPRYNAAIEGFDSPRPARRTVQVGR